MPVDVTPEYTRGYRDGLTQGHKDIFVRLHSALLKRFPYLGFALNEILQATLKEIERNDSDQK